MEIKISFPKEIKRFILFLSLASGMGLFFLVLANFIILYFSPKIVTADNAPTSTTALIFGGGMKTPTEMTDMQYDRVKVGVELYQSGKVKNIMITGDDGDVRADEISAMKKLLIDSDVPISAILVDPHGYRTYESCRREAQVYGIISAIAVSQSFHLPRIAYLCGRFGIQIIPVSADLRIYDEWLIENPREWLARLKAVFEINISRLI